MDSDEMVLDDDNNRELAHETGNTTAEPNQEDANRAAAAQLRSRLHGVNFPTAPNRETEASRAVAANLRSTLYGASDAQASSHDLSLEEKYLEAQRITSENPSPLPSSRKTELINENHRLRAELQHNQQTLEEEIALSRDSVENVESRVLKAMEPFMQTPLPRQFEVIKKEGALADMQLRLEYEERVLKKQRELFVMGQQELFKARQNANGNTQTIDAAQLELARQEGAAHAIKEYRLDENALKVREELLRVREVAMNHREEASKTIREELDKPADPGPKVEQEPQVIYQGPYKEFEYDMTNPDEFDLGEDDDDDDEELSDEKPSDMDMDTLFTGNLVDL